MCMKLFFFITISMYGTNNYNIGIYTLACSSVESARLIFCFLVYLALLGGDFPLKYNTAHFVGSYCTFLQKRFLPGIQLCLKKTQKTPPLPPS